MAKSQHAQRSYPILAPQLFGICATALGQIRARVVSEDIERGTIQAVIGAGLMAPVTELSISITSSQGQHSQLAVTWQARKHGGDQRVIAIFLDSVADLVKQTQTYR